MTLTNIGKTYPGVTALAGVSFEIAPGEVVGLIGENGAGKSTMMKILGGVATPDSGTIEIDGTQHTALTVPQSMAARIAFVHQELNLFDNLDVAANIYIGREPKTGGPLRLIDRQKLRIMVHPLLERLKVDFGPRTPVADLSIAQRQMVEIAKALSLDARLIIMDEPTSSLTVSETERLLGVIEELKSHGVAVIYITHRLNEVEACADRVVCLRDGRLAGVLQRDEIEHDAMIRLMIGRDLKALYTPPARPPSRGAEIRGLVSSPFPDRAVDLDIQRGEILGLAGLVGSGRTELARTIFGIDPPLGGTVTLDGDPVTVSHPREAIAQGIYLVPEDRKQSGLIIEFPIRVNVTLADVEHYAERGLIRRRGETETAERQKKRLNIRAPSVETKVVTLSGGNQQKVVLAKWLSMQPSLMIFDEPTRGIDVGAKAEIYTVLRELADAGVAVLMISSDMEEVIGVSDRIAVMHEGQISGILTDRATFTEENVLELAVNAPAHAAA
nr:sugar ABC transporter ATP-binding protein [Acuticoccus kalidii]